MTRSIGLSARYVLPPEGTNEIVPEPGTDDELRSVYLSTDRSGSEIAYDPEILTRLRGQRDRNRFTPNTSPGALVLRFLVPARLLLIALLLPGATLR